MVDRAGERFADYHLIRRLGGGTFGDVYLAERVTDKTPVAIKILQGRLVNNEDLKDFINEVRILFRLQHPNIVPLQDFGVENDLPFIVMDFAPNGTLRQPKGTHLSLEKAVIYVKQIAAALQYAHERKLIHRDVKPDNILLGPQNQVWLSDFGIAAIAHSSRSLRTQEGAGTIAYMAPEQILGKPRPASDQYALGIIVYEWLCGTRPFTGTAPEIAIQHTQATPPPLREKLPTISPGVEEVVMKTLAKEPYERFVSILAFARALEQAAEMDLARPDIQTPQLPSQQESASSINMSASNQLLDITKRFIPITQSSQVSRAAIPFREFVDRTPTTEEVIQSEEIMHSIDSQPTKRSFSRRTVLVGMAGLALASSGLTWLIFSHRSTVAHSSQSQVHTPVPSTTFSPTSTATPIGTTFLTYRGHSGAVYSARWSPVSHQIASGSYDRTVQVWDAVDGSHIYTYRGHSDGIWTVAWSPNGKRIASGSATINYGNDHTVQVWDAIDGGNAFIYHGHSGAVRGVAWSPNGKYIASGGDDGTLQVWDSVNGNHLFTYPVDSTSGVSTVTWSPDGMYIASGSNVGKVQIWDAATRNSVPILTYNGHSNTVNAVVWSPNGRYIATGSGVFQDNTGYDHTVQVWDAVSGNTIFTYHGHPNRVFAVAWSPDSKRIASGGGYFYGPADHTVQVWDAFDGGHVYTYRGHSSDLLTVAWSSDGKRIASGGEDSHVQIWQAS